MPILRLRVEKVRLFFPSDPRLDHFLIPVAYQPQVTSYKFGLDPFAAHKFFKVLKYVPVARAQFSCEYSPFNVCASPGELLHLNSLTAQHRYLSKDEHLVGKAGADAQRSFAKRPVLRRPNRVGKDSRYRRLTGRAVLLKPSTYPVQSIPK